MKHIISVFIITPFTQMISNRNHAILCKFEWGPKTAQIITGPFVCAAHFHFSCKISGNREKLRNFR